MKQVLKKLISKTGYRISSNKYMLKQFLENSNTIELTFDHVLANYLVSVIEKADDITFLQIGAFDGIACDPLRKYLVRYDWKGVLLEPQPTPFRKLQKVYSDRQNIYLVNAALDHQDGKTKLFILEGDDLPNWSKGMASFSKENILRHEYLIPSLQEHVNEIVIDTISFHTLFNKFNIDKLDLLQIDTEGFDAEIIKMFPFHLLKPSIIHFEAKHIEKSQLECLLDLLIRNNYNIAWDRGEDMMAVLKDCISE